MPLGHPWGVSGTVVPADVPSRSPATPSANEIAACLDAVDASECLLSAIERAAPSARYVVASMSARGEAQIGSEDPSSQGTLLRALNDALTSDRRRTDPKTSLRALEKLHDTDRLRVL